MSSKGVWRECGFDDFIDGTFGNSGQNLYVSRKGILQRIFLFDLDQDGYIDLGFANSHDMDERMPAHVYSDVLGNKILTDLPTYGAYMGAVADLNGDGYDDLVIGMQNNGTHEDLPAVIYYGSPEGLSERYKIELPAPNCRGVAIGDFNGDGRQDIAFSSNGKIRIFYQVADGFNPNQFTELNLDVTNMTAGDLDGDGCDELYVRVSNDAPRVLWGSPQGLDLRISMKIGEKENEKQEYDFWDPSVNPASTLNWIFFIEGWMPKILRFNGIPHLFRPWKDKVTFIPVRKDRTLGEPLTLETGPAISAALGDINGDGHNELIVLTAVKTQDKDQSIWIYEAPAYEYKDERRLKLKSTFGRDVVTGDFNGNGCDDLVVCQGRTDQDFTTKSLIYRGQKNGIDSNPIEIVTHDATKALIARTSDNLYPELIFINHAGGNIRGDIPVCIYHGGPDGYKADRKTELPGWSAPGLLACDFDDDGWADVFVLNSGENAVHLDVPSFLYQGGPSGFSPEKKLVFPTHRAHGIACGDFRKSGYLDILVTGFANPDLLIFRGGPDGYDLQHPETIRLQRDGIVYDQARWLLCADLNNNGWLDVVISQVFSPHFIILWGGPDGFSMDHSTFLPANNSVCIKAADLTGNGWLDLVVGGFTGSNPHQKYESYLYIYWGGPNGFSTSRQTQLPGHAVTNISIADFNNDGMLDIFASSYKGCRERDLDSYIYWAGPKGYYSHTNRKRLFGHSIAGSLALDLNEDGWIDLVTANHKHYGSHNGDSFIWINGSTGFSEERREYLPTCGPHGMFACEPGNIMDRGSEEYYISSPYQLPESAKIEKVEWEALLPPKTWVKAQVRSATSIEALESAPWHGANGIGSWLKKGQPLQEQNFNGLWIQYRLALGAINSGNTPRVSEVQVHYTF